MITKHYASCYALLFIIAFVPATVMLILSGRIHASAIITVLVVAAVIPPILIWLGRRMGYPLGQAVRCARCGTEMPMFRKPKDMRQALHGGYQCANCGAELDARGNELKQA
ncbi:hypothetical protein [Vineibacter terrae]|uniref:hypothetical protein n=1 Tax=Vineibacter terrae TaxID=2586908 RepID=UPI002E379DE5|nr:hypothetical protein [Vineibacter terrae]HEX2885889.1 hypothetical protein [Vineibacter terrae]